MRAQFAKVLAIQTLWSCGDHVELTSQREVGGRDRRLLDRREALQGALKGRMGASSPFSCRFVPSTPLSGHVGMLAKAARAAYLRQRNQVDR